MQIGLGTFEATSVYITFTDVFYSQHHRLVWAQWGLESSSSPNAVQSAGKFATDAGCSEPQPAWPAVVPDIGHLPPLWVT